MSNGPIWPSALEGIKRYAAHLKTSRGLTQAEALNAAAIAGGFPDFAHARRQLEHSRMSALIYTAHISVRWGNRETEESGQETLSVPLTTSATELVTRPQLKLTPYLSQFDFEAADHLDCRLLQQSQTDARRVATAAARSLIFMETTGLRPSRVVRGVYPGGTSANALPGLDHSSAWCDPKTRTYVLTDEPYGFGVGSSRSAEREAWSAGHDWFVRRTTWPSLYDPQNCELYLVATTKKGFNVSAAAARLSALPLWFVGANWEGRSAQQSLPFLSPIAMVELAKPRSRASAQRTPRRGAARS